MIAIAVLFVRLLCDCFQSWRRLEAEILVLRHQLNVLHRRAPRWQSMTWGDRALFVWLYRGFPFILDAITIVRPETVVRWHRMYVAFYNFCRVHETLRTTPAVALQITDHVWSIGELLDAALATIPGAPENAPDQRKRFKVIDGGKA